MGVGIEDIDRKVVDAFSHTSPSSEEGRTVALGVGLRGSESHLNWGKEQGLSFLLVALLAKRIILREALEGMLHLGILQSLCRSATGTGLRISIANEAYHTVFEFSLLTDAKIRTELGFLHELFEQRWDILVVIRSAQY